MSFLFSAGAIDVIPDSVVHQYDFINNWSQGDSTLSDSVGGADMSIIGGPQDATIGGETGAQGDGADDYGSADGPQSLADAETFGIAVTFNVSNMSDGDTWFGVDDNGSGNGRMELLTTDYSGGTIGSPTIYLRDSNGSDAGVSTSTTYDDGATHYLIINKFGDSFSDFEVYVDSTSTADSTDDVGGGGFDNTANAISAPMYVWTNNENGTASGFTDSIFGVLEFKATPYTESERQDFVDRRPEVS